MDRFSRLLGRAERPWHMNQNAAWAAGEMVPMLYDWTTDRRQAVSRQRLFFQNGGVYGSSPESGRGRWALMLDGLKLCHRENFTSRVYAQLRKR